jgi:threonine dehydrogenase-like Zn-dependent dehydrogenase
MSRLGWGKEVFGSGEQGEGLADAKIHTTAKLLREYFYGVLEEDFKMNLNPPIQPMMPTLVWDAPGQMNFKETALPVPQTDDVLIQVAFSGICGSELSGYLGHNSLRIPPLVMGHEFSGHIAALGERAAQIAPELALGQAVTTNPMVFCRQCVYCVSGQTQLCLNRRLIGTHRPGAFARYTTAPAWMVVPLPRGVSLRDGALAEPLACAAHILRLAGDVRGEEVLVIGAGTIGLLTLHMLRLAGAKRVFVSDSDPDRLASVAALGGEALDPRAVDVVGSVRAAAAGLGVRVAIDAVGKAVTREQCVKAARSGGMVLLSGLHEETSSLPVAEAIRREINLQGSFCYSQADFESAVNRLADGSIRLDPWIVEAPLADGQAWFERLCAEKPGKVAKVLLVP